MITELTEEQWKLCDEYYKMGLEIGRDMTPLNREKVEGVITQLYLRSGKQKPLFIFCDSPLSCVLSCSVLEELTKEKIVFIENGAVRLYEEVEKQASGKLREKITNRLGNKLRDRLRSGLADTLNGELDNKLRGLSLGLKSSLKAALQIPPHENLWGRWRKNIDEGLEAKLWDKLTNELWSKLGIQLGFQLRNEILHPLEPVKNEIDKTLPLWNRTMSAWETVIDDKLLWNEIWTKFSDLANHSGRSRIARELFRNKLARPLANYFAGQQWCSWIVFYLFLEEIGVKYSEEDSQSLHLWEEQAKQCHWWFPYEKIVFVSERNICLHVDQSGNLHCENGPAIAYRDGWGIWALNGVRVDRKIVETPAEDLDPRLFLKERDVSIRAVLLKKITPMRLKNKLGAKEVDRKTIVFPHGDVEKILPHPSWAAPYKPMRKETEYKLYLLNLGGSTGEWPYLEMWNESEQCFHLEPVGEECRTVEQALNFRNGGEFEHLAPIS